MAIEAFQSQIFPQGLHLARCKIAYDLSFEADVNAAFRQGQLVKMNTAGKIVRGDVTVSGRTAGVGLFGVAKWTKSTTPGNTIIVDEPTVVPAAGGNVALRRAIAAAATTHIRTAVGGAGTNIAEGAANYVVQANGTITWANPLPGTVVQGQTVYITYQSTLTEADMDFQGRNFWNFNDDVSIQGNRIAIIQGQSLLFTSEYDSTLTYAIGDSVLASTGTGVTAGQVTNAGGGDALGRVVQAPSAADPFLGWIATGNLVT